MTPQTRNNTDGSSTLSVPKSIHLITVIDRDIVKRFPALEVLDNEPIVKVGFDAPIPHTNPSHHVAPIPSTNSFARPMEPSFIAGVNGALVSDFLTRYAEWRVHPSAVHVLMTRSP